ncbi:hypothetical protein AALP_AA6G152900 [Arabis alpina]|uniref:Uncharacterized protein n=1 Tax=Arabis alpina TaxID=50452 RepID=A0A087GPE0_ARAAL|nr:hypothetical protein AALP_AA6G152900 [Arabis alpina]
MFCDFGNLDLRFSHFDAFVVVLFLYVIKDGVRELGQVITSFRSMVKQFLL